MQIKSFSKMAENMPPDKKRTYFLGRHCFIINRNMTSKTDHLERTAESARNNVTSLATVIGLREESKTVKTLRLKIHDDQLTFKAGQWVDMFIPQVDIVGGFSMYSSPEQLQREGTLDLAVKYSKHPPALWVHRKCTEGTDVMVKTGGDVFYDPDVNEPPHDLLLIAGGIGINPLQSILCHVSDVLKGDHSGKLKGDKSVPGKVLLLYSAVTEDELIFKNDIQEMTRSNNKLRCKFYVTKGESRDDCKGRRINKDDIKEIFDWLNKDQTMTYICGPSPMIADVEHLLIEQGLNKQSILYEKWW